MATSSSSSRGDDAIKLYERFINPQSVRLLDVLQMNVSVRMGDYLRRRLTERLGGFEMVREVRGVGMLTGVEFQPPKRLRLRVPFEAFARIHPAMFGQVLVMRLFRDHGMLTQICGNDFMVLKVAPPLIVSEEQIGQFVAAIGAVVELMHGGGGFWSEALGMAPRVIGSI
jgi:ornithine--oxo-acid transaminase